MTMRPFFRWFGLIFSFIFVAFAALQWNDPDPLIWIIAYMIPAVLCFLSFRGVILRLPSLAIAIAYFGAAVYVWPETYQGIVQPMSYAPGIEEARESLGLAICSLILFVVFGPGVKRTKKVTNN